MEEEAKREKKFQEYKKKTNEMASHRLKSAIHNNFVGGDMPQSESAHHANTAGLSALEEYDSYGGIGAYQSAIDYNNELEIQEKIRKHEDKMNKAVINRLQKLISIFQVST